ncbi:MAG: glutamyl-tRNA reductase [Alphaproteobacteria bacterium]|jgi:glutamyl-tRNA reductase|nr:glutamyl-tRNA reductase [Rhodospirillaceae bacterium]MBT7647674.1 glutamyl-tRNA reductase [Rhodospirillaceae bacterium]MDG2480426.1 glutamyl-tRNA reductase [Alphaproteobacteria bacterium]
MTGSVHIAVGANHRSAPLDLRERMFVSRDETPAFYELLKARGFEEALLLSTCDRVEVHALHSEPASAIGVLRDLLGGRVGLNGVDERLYGLSDRAAMRQLFAIASSLDSLVVGEPQVLGQLKESHRRAAASGMMGRGLERRLQSAYTAAKRVRSETRIGERPVSIASAAVEVAREIHGDLGRVRGLLVGAGEAGELIAARLLNHGLQDLAILHNRPRLAQSVAERLEASLVGPDDRDQALAAADILILSVGAGRHAVVHDEMKAALKVRRRRPVFLVDAGVPPDADPAIDRLGDVFVYNLDDLERIALSGRAGREDEAGAAWAIVEEMLAVFSGADAQRDATPAVTALRASFEAVRQEVLAGKGGDDASEATRRLVNRLLHDPSETLRLLAEHDPNGVAGAEDLLQRLFRLRAGENHEP